MSGDRYKENVERIRRYIDAHGYGSSRKIASVLRVRQTTVLETARKMGIDVRANTTQHSTARPGPSDAELLTSLVALTRGHDPLTLEEVCNKLDASPKRVRELADKARTDGYDVHIDNGHVGRKPQRFDAPLEIAPVENDWQIVGVISDTHLGSKYCLREQLRDFVRYAYDQGVRQFLHPGDWLDGCYRHGRFELTHVGIDAQTDDLIEVLPELPGVTYHGIEGNHDNTFRDDVGLDVGRYIEGRFRDAGRNDVRFYGSRGAMLRVRGALFELWHPRGSGAYAKSYKSQVKIRDSFGPWKPDVLLIGHYHTFNYTDERGIHAIMCPTFQGSGSSFGKSLGGTPAIGGLILSWRATKDGTIRDFNLTRRAYYEREAPRELQAMSAVAVEPANYEPVAMQRS